MNKTEIKNIKGVISRKAEKAHRNWQNEYLSWTERDTADPDGTMLDLYYGNVYGHQLAGMLKKIGKASIPDCLVEATEKLVAEFEILAAEYEVIKTEIPDPKSPPRIYKDRGGGSKELFDFLRALKRYTPKAGDHVGCFIGGGSKLHHAEVTLITEGDYAGELGLKNAYRRNWNWGHHFPVCLWDGIPESLKAYTK